MACGNVAKPGNMYKIKNEICASDNMLRKVRREKPEKCCRGKAGRKTYYHSALANWMSVIFLLEDKIQMMEYMELDAINERKERTLILTETDPETDMMFQAWIQNGLKAEVIFIPMPKLIRFVRRAWVDHFLPGYSVWYGSWKRKLWDYDTVILHASERTRTIPLFLHSIKPTMRIIYWYWNPVNKQSLPSLTRVAGIECWSFDQEDCKKYGMRQNIQYYDYPDEKVEIEPEYDVYFIGHDKGRSSVIERIKREIVNLGYKVRIDLVREGSPNIPYEEVQKRIAKSKVILEVTQEGQSGCTLRALESLFMRKKLITTNGNIIHEDFYNDSNIFIFGKDDERKLASFIDMPYDTTSDAFRDHRSIDAWFTNFFEEE